MTSTVNLNFISFNSSFTSTQVFIIILEYHIPLDSPHQFNCSKRLNFFSNKGKKVAPFTHQTRKYRADYLH